MESQFAGEANSSSRDEAGYFVQFDIVAEAGVLLGHSQACPVTFSLSPKATGVAGSRPITFVAAAVFLPVIDALLDTERSTRKPHYLIASEIPLVLQSCEFDDLRFMCSADSRRALEAHFEMECRNYKLEAAIHYEAMQSYSLIENDESIINNNKTIKKTAPHVPLLSRITEPSYEERRTKLRPEEDQE